MLWVLIGYMFLYIWRPFEIWPSLAEARIELIYMLGTLLIALAWPGKRFVSNRMHWALLAFAGAVLLSWALCDWPDKTWPSVYDYLKILVFYALVVTLVRDERELKILTTGFIAVMAIYMTHSLREFIGGRHAFRMGVNRMIGVDNAMNDPNSFGATILYALPIAGAFWVTTRSFGVRALLACYVALTVTCIGLTGSRSAMVGLVAWAALTIVSNRWRWRLALAAIVIVPLLWSILPPALQNRFETIIYPEAGPANALTSAQGRIQGLVQGFELWMANPLSGCGAGAWQMATHSHIESHNLYGQLVGETGTVGALAFIAVLAAFWINVREIRQFSMDSPRLHAPDGPSFPEALARGIGVTVLLLLLEGNFSHNLFRYTWVWYAGFLVVARYCVDQERQRRQLALYWNWMAAAAAGTAANEPVVIGTGNRG